jgi:hypothetical protein
MRVHSSAFSEPKHGNSAAEYEDAYWLPIEGERRRSRHRYAVADGATESSLAREWARLLVQTYGARSYRTLSSTILRARAQWQHVLNDYLADREVRCRPLQWYEREKLQQGAFATLLGLELFDDLSAIEQRVPGGAPGIEGGWRAAAVGDSCLFQVRDDRLIVAFPMSAAECFDCSPILVSTRRTSPAILRQQVRTIDGTWRLYDSFYLATDALASWFLRAWQGGDMPWAQLRHVGIRDASDYAAFVAALRSCSALKNDDVTLLRVDIV